MAAKDSVRARKKIYKKVGKYEEKTANLMGMKIATNGALERPVLYKFKWTTNVIHGK